MVEMGFSGVAQLTTVKNQYNFIGARYGIDVQIHASQLIGLIYVKFKSKLYDPTHLK